MSSIYPEFDHPYYIVTPPYETTSAGVRCLHLLCHSLNLKGQVAYIVQDPLTSDMNKPFKSGPNLMTPHLTAGIAQHHHESSKSPIVVYPETVTGNPFSASCVVRYVLNFPGFLAGDSLFAPNELVFAFSRTLGQSCGSPNVLFIPSIDTTLFKPSASPLVRQGSCFYADKFRKVHGGVPYDVTSCSLEITRHDKGSQSPEEIVAIFQRSEVFYTYENTALAIEAVLCGCPAVFIPNPFLDRIIASAELGPSGFAWGAEPDEVARATATVAEGASNYLKVVDLFWSQLEDFIVATQHHAEGSEKAEDISHRIPEYRRYRSMFEANFLELTRKLPMRVEREIGKALCTVGLRKSGQSLWINSLFRDPGKIEVREKSEHR